MGKKLVRIDSLWQKILEKENWMQTSCNREDALRQAILIQYTLH